MAHKGRPQKRPMRGIVVLIERPNLRDACPKDS